MAPDQRFWEETSALETLQERLGLRYFGAAVDGVGPDVCAHSDRWCPGQASCGIRSRQAGNSKTRRKHGESLVLLKVYGPGYFQAQIT